MKNRTKKKEEYWKKIYRTLAHSFFPCFLIAKLRSCKVNTLKNIERKSNTDIELNYNYKERERRKAVEEGERK